MSVLNVKSETDLSGFYIVYKGSVCNEKKGIFGISHLSEHLICHSFDDMYDDFDRDGIANNAYTSDNEIVFYFTGLDEHLVKYKDEILKRILKFSITEEMFQNERKIVLEEYKDYFNKQNYNHSLNLTRKLFNNFGPIGLREDLENLTLKDVEEYFDLQFSKPHMIINVSKHSDFECDIEFCNKTFKDVAVLGEYDTYYPGEEHTEEAVELEPYSSRNGKTSIIVMSKVIEDDFAYVDFITDMLGSGLRSPLYQEIREKKGLAYYVRSGLDRMTNNSATVQITSETSDDNVDEFLICVKDILSNPDKYMTQERFDICKQAIEIQKRKHEINRYNNVNKFITPKEWQIENYLEDLTLDKVMKIYDKYFNYDNFIESIDTIDFPSVVKSKINKTVTE
jgi:predicted Zn-dependent peptidase